MNDTMPLSLAKEGALCEIDDVVAGRGLTIRLAELGFIRGTQVGVTRSESGALIVSVSGQKYALSRGIANKIMVRCV